MPFDDSGQVYEERIWKPQFKDHTLQVYSEAHRRPSLRVSSRGARSLEDVAMNTILRSLDAITASLLQRMPTALVSRIWAEICRKKLDSVRIWKEFAATKCENLARIKNWTFRDPIHGQLFRQITSSSFDWLTTLKIHRYVLDVSDFMTLSAVQNVSRVYISYSGTGGEIFSDRIIAAWAADATDRKAFQKLQGIFVQGCENITAWALQYLMAFPVLTKFFTHECGDMNPPNDDLTRGWHRSSSIHKLLRRTLEERPGMDFSDVVDSVLQQQCSLNDENAEPVLTLCLEPSDWRPGRGHRFARLSCFEKTTGHNSEAPARDIRPAGKKRKVSDERQVHLSKRITKGAMNFTDLLGM